MTLHRSPAGKKPSVTSPRFLDHVCRTVTHEQKADILTKHYNTIAREMQRIGTWRRNARLLDVGCGIGLYSEYWHGRGMNVTAVDVDAEQISIAARRAKEQDWDIRYRVASGDRLPFKACSFDIVYANSIFEHVEQWEQCLTEWVRVLAPGGLLWIETTNVLCPRQGEFRWLPLYSWWPSTVKHLIVRVARGQFPALVNYTPCPALHWFSFFQLERWFKGQGLAIRDRFDCLDTSGVGPVKRMIRTVALSSRLGRYLAYLLISPLVVVVTRPA
jgi:2-polyprenyl-6-hydroxyphenyl methylase/3-demethylubiquinone-9 3-methyltransferase